MPTTRNKPWTLGASITLQCAVVGTAVLYSALHVDLLPLNSMRHLELPMRAIQEPAIKLVGGIITPRTGALTMTPRPFTAPSKIPTTIAKIDDGVTEAPALASGSALVGIGSGTTDSVIGSLGFPTTAVAPPKPLIVHAQPAVKPSGPVRLGGQVQDAKILKRVIPLYPPLAKQARISGKVHLLSIIAKDGSIQKLEVIDGHPLLIAAAIDAVRQWIYRPTMLNGEPVDVIAPIEVNFTLTQ